MKPCEGCGKTYNEIPKGAKYHASGDAFEGYYWQCSCEDTIFISADSRFKTFKKIFKKRAEPGECYHCHAITLVNTHRLCVNCEWSTRTTQNGTKEKLSKALDKF